MQGVNFYISLFLFTNCLFFNHVSTQAIYSLEINPGNGLERGDWGPIAQCPPGTYAAKFEIKYEPWGSVDVTNTDAVKFYCYDSNWTFVTYVTSTEGTEGTWQGIRSCPQGKYIIGYSMDVLEDQGTFGDDVGVSNMKVECEDGTILDGLTPSTLYEESKTEPKDKKAPSIRNLIYKLTEEDNKRFNIRNTDESKLTENEKKVDLIRNLKYKLTEEDKRKLNTNKHVGHRPEPQTFGPLATCPTGQKVCGLKTRVEDHAVSDDAGVTDVTCLCCD